MPQAATIIDLASVRQERERARRRSQTATMRPPTIWMPVYVAFVPVWPMA